MKTEDTLIKRYHDLGGIKFKILSRMEMVADQSVPLSEEIGQVTLMLELMTINNDDTKLRLIFRGVKDLRFIPLQGSIIYFSQLKITNIDDKQWENVTYKVSEQEDNTLYFLCSSFEATVFS
jgi:hypothetical protein